MGKRFSTNFHLEGGIAARERLNYTHFHRRGDAGDEQTRIFPSVIRFLLVLDLSATKAATDKDLLQRVETAWNRAVRQFLSTGNYSDPSQHGRSESRWIPGPTPPMTDVLRLMNELVSAHSSLL